ncbi:hypothetical protein [Sphingobium sp. Sx8-8]|uniref:hypothetical protein n=1 Tax=Sphingobium sp. Sx8-8 TaxID=2933617 RepID=UPI001F56BD7D|nr:hypothetical protein [Sphingobium sp. Sx8-8]
MIFMPNEMVEPGGPFGWDMTAFELAIFVCVFRSHSPMQVDEICRAVGRWFECSIPREIMAETIGHMIGRGWLIKSKDRMRASVQGREVARPLMNGIIRMLDQGTRLLDVALMMSLLQLTRGELDSAPGGH